MTYADFPAALDAALVLAEGRVDAVEQALLLGQPGLVEAATRELQQAARLLSGLPRDPGGRAGPDRQGLRRIAHLARRIAQHREAVLRHAAAVERALHSIVPAARASTYAGGPGQYGPSARQSGAFGLLAG